MEKVVRNVKMVIGHFRPFGGGTSEQAELLAQTLLRRNINVDVYTGRPRGVPERLADDAFPVRRLWVPGFGRIKQILLIWKLYKVLVSKKNEMDIIHAHQALYPAYAGALAARRLKVPLIVKCGNSGSRFDLDYLEKNFPFGRHMADVIVRNTSLFISLNKEMGDQLIRRGVDVGRIVNIPNGVVIHGPVTSQDKETARRNLDIKTDDLVLISVGSLTAKKNFSFLLKALHGCNQKTDLLLLIVGDGPLMPALKEESRALGLSSHVRFIGPVPHARIRGLLASADIFVLPSLAEGISNALLEAMEAGLACIASDISGNRAVIEDGATGILFKSGDLSALTKAIELLRDKGGLRKQLGSHARQEAEDRYSIDKVADKYVDLYERLFRQNNPS